MKRIIFGLMVVATAFGASAFTNATRGTGDYVGQDPAIDQEYKLISNIDFSSSNCVTDENPCAFQVLTNATLPSPLTLTYILAHPEQFQPVRNSSNEIIQGVYVQ